MALTKVIGAGAEGLTLSSTDLKIDSGDLIFSTGSKGVVLGATSNTDANTISDYEEGTWTPVILDASGSALTTVNVGSYYNKLGDMVNLWFYIQRNDGGSATNTLQISGLPFTSKSADFASLCGQVWIDNTSQTDRKVFIYLGPNQTIASVVASGTTSSNTNTNEVDNARYLYGNLSYLV